VDPAPLAVTRDSRITLAVPTRDRPDLVARFLVPGLIDVTARGFAAVVVDQTAGDETRALVEPIEGVRYLRSPPPLSRGRNVAVEAAATPLLAFTDDDVAFDGGWLERVAEAFTAPETGAVCGRARTPEGELLPGRPAGTYRWPANPFGLGSGFNVAFRLAALAVAGPFDEELGAGARFRSAEDSDMLYRILRAGWTVVCSDDLDIVHHDQRSGGGLVRLHHGYGLGAGAQTAKHVLSGDRTAGRIALAQALRHFGWAARSLATFRPGAARLQLVYVRGLLRGFRERRAQRA